MIDLYGTILRHLVDLKRGEDLTRSDQDTAKLITPDQFYSSTREKTKLNWFCFEYALELEQCIETDRGLRAKLTRKGVDAAQIAGFCVHYAKHMKGEVLARVSGVIPLVRIGYDPIESYFPSIGDALVDELLTAAAKAWDSQTECCVMCPIRCISEREQRAPMFDDPFYWE